jgi:anti-anti-sigma factor
VYVSCMDFGVTAVVEGTVVLLVAGDIDSATSSKLAAAGISAIGASDCQWLIVDLTEATFSDPSGLAALIAIHNEADKLERKLSLRAPPRGLLRRVTDAGLTRLFDIETATTSKT